MTLFIWNGDPVLLVGCARLVGGLLDRLAVTSGVLDISDIMQSFDYEKYSIISQLIKGKLKDLEKLLNYFIQTTLLCLMHYCYLVCFNYICLTCKIFTCCCLLVIYPIIINFIIFIFHLFNNSRNFLIVSSTIILYFATIYTSL